MSDDLLTVLDPDGIVFTSQGSPAFHEACWYNQGQGMAYSARAFINAAASQAVLEPIPRAWQADPARVRQLCGWGWIRDALTALADDTQATQS